MNRNSERHPKRATTPCVSWTNEGTRLVPSCSPSQGKESVSVEACVQCARCAHHRLRVGA